MGQKICYNNRKMVNWTQKSCQGFAINSGALETRPDTWHRMRLVCVLFTFKNNTGNTD